jgi:hypothetical protein
MFRNLCWPYLKKSYAAVQAALLLSSINDPDPNAKFEVTWLEKRSHGGMKKIFCDCANTVRLCTWDFLWQTVLLIEDAFLTVIQQVPELSSLEIKLTEAQVENLSTKRYQNLKLSIHKLWSFEQSLVSSRLQFQCEDLKIISSKFSE